MVIVWSILALVLGIIALVVVFSYAIVWYEFANADPRLLEGRFTPANLWLAARLIVIGGVFPPRDRPAPSPGMVPPRGEGCGIRRRHPRHPSARTFPKPRLLVLGPASPAKTGIRRPATP